MKKAMSYLFVVFLAALVFYGGAGVNLITYCCGDCRTESMIGLSDEGCCKGRSAHAQKDTSVSACCQVEEEDGCCDVEYISFDWTVFHHAVFDFQPLAVDLISSSIAHLSSIPLLLSKEAGKNGQDSPPRKTPDVYLSFLTILLI